MFRVYINGQDGEFPLYEPLDDELRIFDPTLTQEMGCGGCFKFLIHESHPYAGKISLLKSEIIVFSNEKEIFRGRVFKPEYGMKRMVSVTAEGDLCYLVDSQQPPYSMEGSVESFIEGLLAVHNSQADAYKQMQVGIITVANAESETTRSEAKYTTTLEALKSKLVDELGGYLRVRNEGGKKYLDYLWDFGGVNEQAIRFGENLLDINRYMDAASIITCLNPIGAEVEYTDELGETQVRQVDITSVNGGKPYIQNDAGIEKYGKVWGTKQWKDITDPGKLLTKAKAYLAEASGLPDTMEIKAIDLSAIDESVQEFHLGYWTDIISEPHGVEKKLLLSKRVINLLDPTAGSISLGGTKKTFLDTVVKGQQDAIKAADKVAESASQEITRKIENATNLITGGLGGYVVLDNIDPATGKKMHPWRILVMNTPDKETAKNIIQINQNGIGFSTTGISGPYRNAWTIDGNLVADFITAGTMLADRMRGGTLELGGTGLGRDGSIAVMDINGNRIGSWDKTGLTILKGILQGVSAIFGGLDNQDGAIEVRNASNRTIGRWDKDGIYISRGNIRVGPFSVDEDGVILGDYEVSADGTNVFRSLDGSITIQNESGGPFGSYPAISVGGGKTILSDHHLETVDVQLRGTSEWGGGHYSGSVSTILDAIWNNRTWGLEALEQRISDLENSI